MQFSKVSSLAEARMLEAQRKQAVPTFELTPHGPVAVDVNTEVARKREDRINFIRNRLAEQSGKARNQHSRAACHTQSQ